MATHETEKAGMADGAQPTRRRYGWAHLLVAGVFALFYAYDVWEAVGNLIALPDDYRANGIDTALVPWWVLIVALVLPVVVFAIAFVAGRRRVLWQSALLFLVGLAVVAGLSLGLIALAEVLRPLVLLIPTTPTPTPN